MQTKKTLTEPKRSADFELEVARQAGQSCGGRSESKTHFCFPIWSVIFLVITLGKKKLFPISERCAKDPLSCCLRWEETIYLVCIGNKTWKILYSFFKAIRKCVLRCIIKYSMQFMYVSIRIFIQLWSWLRFLLFCFIRYIFSNNGIDNYFYHCSIGIICKQSNKRTRVTRSSPISVRILHCQLFCNPV